MDHGIPAIEGRALASPPGLLIGRGEGYETDATRVDCEREVRLWRA
jgi:hypothetical protein